MRFLLDTNIIIPAEPTSAGDVEPTTRAVVDLLKALAVGGHVATLHPSSVTELRGDRNVERGQARAVLLGKYPLLVNPPSISTRLVAVLGIPAPGSNTEIDLHLLSAVDANAVDYFVTEDDGIHRRARRVNLTDRVLTVADALVTVRAFFPTVPEAPPFVQPKLAYELAGADPIFESFRREYGGFDDWLAKCKRQHRQSWVVTTGRGYGGICIIKDETPNAHAISGKVLKLCSFKIAEPYRGYRYGELLLKTVFSYLVENAYDSVFVEAFPHHRELFTLFSDFGFVDAGRETARGERVLVKTLKPAPNEAERLGPLEYNVRYGPHALSIAGAKVFLVPIQPRYHALLFPDVEAQQVLPTESHPFGNSIRKAYLCHSRITRIAPGDLILFYRSQMDQGVTTIGVAEGTLVSSDPSEIARFVGRRTVYSYAEIARMASKPVLAVLFRMARGLNPPWGVDLLIRAGIMKRAPQSFMQVTGKAVDWIGTQLAAQR
jgi:hypothetical protein